MTVCRFALMPPAGVIATETRGGRKPWEVDDGLWERIEPLLPVSERRFPYPGRRRLDDRRVLCGILFVLYTGIPWRYLPQELGFGSGMTCWRRLREWNEAGVWQRLHEMLLAELRAAGKLDLSRASVDSSHLRAMKGGAATGPSPVDRGRTGSKHHVIVGAHGIPLAATLTGGNRNDVTQLIPLIRAVPPIRGKRGQPLRRPKHLYADRGYDHESYRDQVRRFEITPRIARRGTEHGSASAYTAGSWKAPSHYCTGSAAYASAGRSATTSTSLHHTRLCRHLLATTEDPALITVESKVESHVANSRQAQGGGMLANASALAAGRRHSVGRRWDGTVLAVGNTAAAECRVERWEDVIAVAAGNVHTATNTGRSHTVGLRSDGTVLATGWNGDGQCDVAGWRGVTAVAAGWRRTLGLLANGRVLAVGRSSEGQCDVQSWREMVVLSCGDWHSVGVRSDGSALAAGTTDEGSVPLKGGVTWPPFRPGISIPSASEPTGGQ